MLNLFISYASPDQTFAVQLAHSLKTLGYNVWIDLHYIQVGESITQRIQEAIERSDYLYQRRCRIDPDRRPEVTRP